MKAMIGRYVTTKHVDYNDRHGILFRIINPPLHPIGEAVIAEIYEGVRALRDQFDGDFVIFHGEAAKSHVGANIKEFAGYVEPKWALKHTLEGTFAASVVKNLERKDIRTVGVMDGAGRYGGSVEWPLWSEYVVAAADVNISLPEVTLGLIPGWGGPAKIAAKAGPNCAFHACATAETFDAITAKEMGIIDEIPLQSLRSLRGDPVALIETALKVATDENYNRNPRALVPLSKEDTKKKIEANSNLGPLAVRSVEELVYDAYWSVDDTEEIDISRVKEMVEKSDTLKNCAHVVDELGERGQAYDRAAVIGAIRCAELMLTEDRKEGVDAFIKKRAPVFSGK